MKIADSRARNGPGICPAQHHPHDVQQYPTHARVGQLSTRIVAREEPSEVRRVPLYVHGDDDTRMDHGKFLVPEPRGEEPLGQWGWVQSSRSTLTIRDPFGAGTEERGETPSGAPGGGGGGMGGVLTDDPGAAGLPPFAANFQRDRDWSEDERIATLIPPMLPKQDGRDLWPELPRHDFVGVVVEATEENEQIEHWHPTDPRMVSVNVAGDPKIGSWTGDLDGSNGIDLDRIGREQSHTRVVKEPTGCAGGGGMPPPPAGPPAVVTRGGIGVPPPPPPPPGAIFKGVSFPSGSNSLALQIGESGKGDVRGGLVFDKDAGDKIGMLSHQQSGIVQAKCPAAPKHVIGTDADGNEIAATHLPLDVYFTDDGGAYDGPLKHDGFWQGAIRGPYSAEVFFEYDPTLAHPFVCGPRSGRHRWRAETFWCPVPPETPDEPDEPFEEIDRIPFFPGSEDFERGEGFVPGKGFPRETRGPETDRSGIDEGDLPADGTPQDGPPPAVRTPAQGEAEGFEGVEEFGEAPLEGLREARQRGREERTRKQRFSDFRVVEPWQPEDGKRIFAGTHVETAMPAVLYRAQHFGEGALDFRSLMRLPTEAILGYNSTAPVVARDEAWGRQTEDRGFEYTDEPCKARYHGGTAPGGVALMPPERCLADFAAAGLPSGELPARTTSRTYRLFEQSVRVGWFSTLNFDTGLPGGGPQWRHRLDLGLNRLELAGFSSAGAEIAATTANHLDYRLRGEVHVEENLHAESGVRLEGVISPSLAADQDDWSPAGLDTATVIRLTNTGSLTIDITGLDASAVSSERAFLILINIGANNVRLLNENAGSVAANRFLTGLTGAAIVTLIQDASVMLWYDATSTRWRVV